VSAQRLRPDTRQRVPRFAVVGQYGEAPASRFVQHVALLRSDQELGYATPDVRVWHMGPPLVAGTISEAATVHEATCTVHMIGVVDLDAQDVEGIETWLAEVDTEDRPSGKLAPLRQYTIHPAVLWVTAENGTRLYRRFSCVGFVLDGYRAIGINLIDDSRAENLPAVNLETVADAYGEGVRNERLRNAFGIPGDGPWPILLAGYLIHALNRSDAEIRTSAYLPSSAAKGEFPLE